MLQEKLIYQTIFEMSKKLKLKDVFIETETEKIPIEQFMVYLKKQYIALSDEINDKLEKLSTYNLRKKTQAKNVFRSK